MRFERVYLIVLGLSCLLPNLSNGAKKRQPPKIITSNNIPQIDEDLKAFESDKEPSEVCQTELCTRISSRFRTMGKLDGSVSPCDDFYTFACGGFGGSIKKWAQEIVLSRLDDIFNEVFSDFNPNQEPDTNSSSESNSMKRLRSLYNSCIDREIGYEPLLRILRKLGGFPLLSNLTNWNSNRKNQEDLNWLELLLRMSPLGLDHNHFFSLTIGLNSHDTSSIVIKLGPLNFQEPDIEFVENDLRTLSDIDPQGLNRDEAIHQLVAMKRLQQSLYNISNCETREARSTTIGELHRLAPRTNWLSLIRFIFETKEVGMDERLIVTNESFIRQLDQLLWKTEYKTLVNYIFMNIINDLKPELIFDANAPMSSIKEDCRQRVAKELSFDLSSEYSRRFTEPHVRNRVYSLARYVQRELKFHFEHSHQSSSGMLSNHKIRQKAKEKLDTMLLQVGYTNELMNGTILDMMFNGISKFNDNEDYLTNLLKLSCARRNHEAAHLHKPYRTLAWENFSRAFQVNAAYQPAQNSISLFAGLLTEAHYLPKRPQYMNFATIGSAIGHELGHAFDADCARREECGNLHPEQWWDAQTGGAYSTRARCIERLYDNLELISHNELNNITQSFNFVLNGTQTLGENLADFTGYKLAYSAYKRWFKDNQERVTESEFRLPRMEQFNERQLFWLTLANKRCDFDPIEKQARKFSKNNHAPEIFRVNIPLQNIKEFSKDFNCPLGSPMNPIEKCQLW